MRYKLSSILYHSNPYLIAMLSLGGFACSTGIYAEIAPSNSNGVLDGGSSTTGPDNDSFEESQGSTSSSSLSHTSTTVNPGTDDSETEDAGSDTDADSIPPTTSEDASSDNSSTTETTDASTSTTNGDTSDTTGDSDPDDLELPIGELVPDIFEQISPDFRKCYTFVALAEIEYTLSIAADMGPMNRKIQVEIHREDGEVLLSPSKIDILDALVHSFSSNIDSPARLCLSAPNANGSYEYRLRLDPDFENGLKQDSMSFEPNNSAATSKIIDEGEETSSMLSSDILDFRDCYRLPTETDVQYSLTLAAESAVQGQTIYIDLSTSDGSTLLDTHKLTVGTAFTQTFSTPAEEHAVLCAKTNNFDGTYNYRFRIDKDWKNGLEQDSKSFEPNNTVASAYGLAMGKRIQSTLSDRILDFRDCYRFEIDEETDHTLIVVIEPQDNPSSIDFEVLADNGETIVESQTIATGSTTVEVFRHTPAASHATACLSTSRFSQQFDYQIRSDPDWNHDLMQDASSGEPNDSSPTATLLPLDERILSSLIDDPMDTVDCYRVMNLEDEERYSLTLRAASEGTGKQIRAKIFSGLGEKTLLPTLSVDTGKIVERPFTMDDGGHATICIYAESPTSQQEYSILVASSSR